MVTQHPTPANRGARSAPATRSRTAYFLLATLLWAGASLGTRQAQADSAADSAAAQSLYDSGKALLAKGETAKACEKLAASQRLDPAPGTQFHLAGCYEQLGRTASAWALYLEVAAAAKSKGRADAEQAARSRAEALAGKLSTLAVDVPNATRITGLQIKRDGQLIAPDLYGSAVAVDPGKHVIEASAPGHQSLRQELEVKPGGDAAIFKLPALRPNAAADADGSKTSSAPALDSSTSSLMPWPYVSLGVGLLGVGVGGFFILKSSSKRADADALFAECGDAGCRNSDPRAAQIASLDDDARGAQTLGTIGFVAGGLGIAGAVVLFLLEPSSQEQAKRRPGPAPSRAAITPWIGPATAGLSGRF